MPDDLAIWYSNSRNHYLENGNSRKVRIFPWFVPYDLVSPWKTTVTKSRMFQGDVIMEFDGSTRSLYEMSDHLPEKDGEKSVIHDKIELSDTISLPTRDIGKFYQDLYPPCRVCTSSSDIRDFYAYPAMGHWYCPVGANGCAEFSIYRKSGGWRGSAPSIYVVDSWKDEGTYYTLQVAEADVPGSAAARIFPDPAAALAFIVGNLESWFTMYKRGSLIRVTDCRIRKSDMVPKLVYIKGDGYQVATRYTLDPDSILDWGLIDHNHNHEIPLGLESALATEAVGAFNFNTNNIANLLSISKLIGTVRHPGSILKDLKAGANRSLFEKSSDAWLKLRYVYSTTLSDVEESVRYFRKEDTDTARAGRLTDKGEMHVKITVANSLSSADLSQFDKLSRLGLAPDLYNLWDLVPYSFVVDWFTGIGDLLGSVTDYGKALKYDVKTCVTSWKWKEEVDLNVHFPGYGDFNIKPICTHYARYVTGHMPRYIPYMETTVSDETMVKRCFDGIALFIG